MANLHFKLEVLASTVTGDTQGVPKF